MNALTVALLLQADHEKQQAERWYRVARLYGLEVTQSEPAEHMARAALFTEWAAAIDLGVSTDFIRYGTERRNLA